MKILRFLLAFCLLAGTAFAGTLTPNIGLYKPDFNEAGAVWWSRMNGNFDILDSAITNATININGTVCTLNGSCSIAGGGGGGGGGGGVAGGDLTGSYPNPTVTKINGVTVPASATLIGTSANRQLIPQTGTIPNNTTGSAGSLSAISAIPNGTTGTTQSLGDSTSKLATNAFVAAAMAASKVSPAFTGGITLTPGIPSVLGNGMCWTTTNGLYCRINGFTMGPMGVGGVGNLSKQVYASGSGTYTTPPGTVYIHIRMIGGGGGGGGSGQWTPSTPAAGTAGTNTTFGTLVAGAGGAGYTSGGSGGTASGGDLNIPGYASILPPYGWGGAGGSYFVNTGGDGYTQGMGGGGQGAYVEAWITNPSGTYAYSIGAGGAGGGDTSTGGGTGSSGIIVIDAH